MKKYIKLLIFILPILFLVLSCSDRVFLNNSETEPNDYLFNGISIIKTGHQQFDYIANDSQGNTVFFDWGNSLVTKALCYTKDGSWLEMHFNSEGIPVRVYSNDLIVIIDNYSEPYADFAVISTITGEISVYRNVTLELNIQDRGWLNDVSYGLRLASVALTSFGVAMAIISPGPHAPITITLGGVSLVLSVLSAIAADHIDGLETSSLAFNIGAEAIGCGSSVLSCVTLGLTISSIAAEIADDHVELINSAEGILTGGYGDIQITLTWDNSADLDLYVTDPWGETICYYNTTSSSGGWLDIDNTWGFGPENVFWESSTAPSGQYLVEVHHFSGLSPSNYMISVVVGTSVDTFSGTILSNQRIQVCSFTYGQNSGINIESFISDFIIDEANGSTPSK